jgi:hypothetical protein
LAQGILIEKAMAIGAQVKSLPPVNVLADIFGFVGLQPFQDLFQIKQIIFVFIGSRRIDGCLNFDPNDVPHFDIIVDHPLTTIT